MDTIEFLDIQFAFVYLFGPLIAWWLVFLVSGGIFISIGIIWSAFLNRLAPND